MTPYPGVAQQRPVWRRREMSSGPRPSILLVIGVTATVVTRNAMDAREQERAGEQRLSNGSEQAVPHRPSCLHRLHRPRHNPNEDTVRRRPRGFLIRRLPAARSRRGIDGVVRAEHPIEQLKSAIESRLPSKMEEVYQATSKMIKRRSTSVESSTRPIRFTSSRSCFRTRT